MKGHPGNRELSNMLGLTRKSLTYHWPQIRAYPAPTSAKPNQINCRNAGLLNCLHDWNFPRYATLYFYLNPAIRVDNCPQTAKINRSERKYPTI
jgi:hypothetical protein